MARPYTQRNLTELVGAYTSGVTRQTGVIHTENFSRARIVYGGSLADEEIVCNVYGSPDGSTFYKIQSQKLVSSVTTLTIADLPKYLRIDFSFSAGTPSITSAWLELFEN